MNASAAPAGARPFAETKENPERLRPIKPLPSDRVSASNQINILRAWRAISENGTRAATVNEVAKAVRMAASTVAMTNPFFASIGLLQRLAVGTYAPSSCVIAAFTNSTNAELSAMQLAPAFRQAWFGQVLVPRLSCAPMDERDAISLLEGVARSGPEYRKAVGIILELMATVGIIERDSGQIRLAESASIRNEGSTIIVDDESGQGQFHVSIRVDSKDLTAWAPEQIVAFFDGLTKLLPPKKQQ